MQGPTSEHEDFSVIIIREMSFHKHGAFKLVISSWPVLRTFFFGIENMRESFYGGNSLEKINRGRVLLGWFVYLPYRLSCVTQKV